MAREVEIGGQKYRIGTLGARLQYHVTRKLSPFLVAFMEAVAKNPGVLPSPPAPGEEGKTPEEQPKPENVIPFKLGTITPLSASNFAQLADMMQPVSEVLAAMTVEDSDYVLNTCLSVVQRWQGAGWASVIEMRTGQIMFADIQMPTMVRLVWEVIQDNLLSFFTASGLTSAAPTAAQ